MIKRLVAIMALVASILPASSVARDANGVVELRVPPMSLDPDKAYLLFRSSRVRAIEHTFMRVPSRARIAVWKAARQVAYDAALPGLQKKAKGGHVPSIEEFAFEYGEADNIFSTDTDRFLLDGAYLRTFLLEVPPGEYVIYGVSVGGRVLITCNCLGTVAFTAYPGTITNVGTLYAGTVHNQSPLAPLESNVGPSMSRYGWIMGQALVPPAKGEVVPEALRIFPLEPADMRAVAPFHDRFAASINRLAPIPGVLAYERGKVMDVKSGMLAR